MVETEEDEATVRRGGQLIGEIRVSWKVKGSNTTVCNRRFYSGCLSILPSFVLLCSSVHSTCFKSIKDPGVGPKKDKDLVSVG